MLPTTDALLYSLVKYQLPPLLIAAAFPGTMKPEDVTTLFTERASIFELISGQPTDSDLVVLREVLTQILFLVPYNEVNGIHSLIGLIQDKTSYAIDYKATFPRPNKPGIYNSKIPKRPRMESIPEKMPFTKRGAAITPFMKRWSDRSASSSSMRWRTLGSEN